MFSVHLRMFHVYLYARKASRRGPDVRILLAGDTHNKSKSLTNEQIGETQSIINTITGRKKWGEKQMRVLGEKGDSKKVSTGEKKRRRKLRQ